MHTERGQQGTSNSLALDAGFDGHRSQMPMRSRRIMMRPCVGPVQNAQSAAIRETTVRNQPIPPRQHRRFAGFLYSGTPGFSLELGCGAALLFRNDLV